MGFTERSELDKSANLSEMISLRKIISLFFMKTLNNDSKHLEI